MIPKWVGKYIGLPFEHCNCWELMRLVFWNEFDIELPEFAGEYDGAMDGENIERIYIRELSSRFKRLPDQKQFSFIVLRISGRPWHCGLVVDKNQMLHTDQGVDSVHEPFNTLNWKHRIVGYYEYDPK